MSEIRPFEAIGALRTTVVAKAWRRFGGVLKRIVSWNLVSTIVPRGHPILERVLWREVVSFLRNTKFVKLRLFIVSI